jgi:hypothetical protein
MSVRRLVVAGLATLCVAALGAGSAQAQAAGGLTLAAALPAGFTGQVAAPATNPLTGGEVVTEAASEVSASGAKLNGTVLLPGGGTVRYYFEYGPSTGYGVSTAEAEAIVPAGSGEVPVTVKIGDLQAGKVYHYRLVAEGTDGNDQAFETEVVPPSEPQTEPATEVKATSAQLNGKVAPGGRASYYFEYGTSPCEVSSEACGTRTREEGISGASQQAVGAIEAAPLAAGTTYYYWVVASNGAGAVHGQQQQFTTPPAAPMIAGEAASGVGVRSVTVSAQITTQGLPVTYYVEYGTTGAYGSKTPEMDLGAAGGSVTASAQLTGLAPSTSYHVRIVVANADGTTLGGDVGFRTLAPGIQGLPDGRVYEMVTPPENQGADVYRRSGPYLEGGETEGVETTLPFQAAAGGDAIAYVAEPTSGHGAGNGLGGSGEGNEYLATRGPEGGWTQVNLQPPGYFDANYVGFSSQLSTGMLSASNDTFGSKLLPPLTPEMPSGFLDLFVRSNGEASYRALNVMTPNRGSSEFNLVYGGQSSDGQVVFEANDALLEGEGPLAKEVREAVQKEIAEGENQMFLYDYSGGRLNLVNVLPDGLAEGNAVLGAPRATGEKRGGPDRSHVISEDGSRVFWTDLSSGDVYVRENGATTVPVSAGAARYWTATPDGRYAFYTEGEELWRFAAEGGTRAELAGGGAGVLGVIGASDDGEYVYFTATGSLAAGASEGEANLYLWHAGVTTFIAKLSVADGNDVNPFNRGGLCQCGGIGDWSASLGFRTAEVAPDGRSVVFMSDRSLAVEGFSHGYANEGMDEVYVYEAEGSGRLFCVSCSVSGEPPSPPPLNEEGAASWLPLSWNQTYAQQWLSEGGGRVIFETNQALVPQDTNGQVDVYEWERNGTGSCQESAGCVYLLSGGSSEGDSWLAGESASGNDVFIITRAQLTPQDPDSAYNLFDARVGGVQPITPPQCQGTGCQGLPSAPPIFATPPSQTFNGVGNFASASVAPVKAAKPKKTVKVRSKKKARGGRGKGRHSARRSRAARRTDKTATREGK